MFDESIELTFYRLLCIYARAWKTILAASAGFSAFAFVLLLFLRPLYGFQALIEPAAYPASDLSTQNRSPALLDAATLKKEAIGYLTFKYVDPREARLAKAFIRRVEEVKGADLIALTTYGETPAEARQMADTVLMDLQAKYLGAVEEARSEAKLNLGVYEDQIGVLGEAINLTRRAIEHLGYSAVLVQQQNELEDRLYRARSATVQYQAQLSPEHTHNFLFKTAQPMDSLPVSPKFALWSALAALFGAAISMTFLFLIEDDRLANRKPSPPALRAAEPPPFRPAARTADRAAGAVPREPERDDPGIKKSA